MSTARIVLLKNVDERNFDIYIKHRDFQLVSLIKFY